MICEHGISGARLASWWRKAEERDEGAPPIGVCGCCTGPAPVVLVRRREVGQRVGEVGAEGCGYCKFCAPQQGAQLALEAGAEAVA